MNKPPWAAGVYRSESYCSAQINGNRAVPQLEEHPSAQNSADMHQYWSLHNTGMRQPTIPALYVAAAGSTPLTATTVDPIRAKRYHRKL